MKAILEMEMPESCYACKINTYQSRQAGLCNVGTIDKDSLHPDCPLKIIEEPADD